MALSSPDRRMSGAGLEEAPTERFYLDDDLIEDFNYARSQATRLPVVRIEREDRRCGSLRPVACMLAGVLLALAVSVIRSKVSQRHSASSTVPRASRPRQLRPRAGSTGRGPSRPAHRTAHRRTHHRRLAARGAGYHRPLAGSTSSVATSRVVYVPAGPPVSAPPARGEEFGFER